MAVTITATADPALSSQLLLSGTLKIQNALDNGSESILVSVYNKTTGATFTSSLQTYDTSKTLTFSYSNGTTMSLNLTKETWVYQRLATETGNTSYTYIFTFQWSDTSGQVTQTLTVETRENIVVNTFSLNELDDIDKDITGTCDVSIVNPQGVSVTPTITANGSTMAGSAKTLSTSTDVLSWTFVNSTVLTVDFGKKTITYTRLSSQVNDKSSDIYEISLDFSNNVVARGTAVSQVGFAVAIKTFSANSAVDTDTTIKGNLAITNGAGASVTVNVTHNGVLNKGNTQTVDNTPAWTYSDGSTFTYNTNDNSWIYTRVAGDTQNLTADTYIFEVLVSNKYGSDSVQQVLITSIPKATILAFSADNVADSDKTVRGVLNFELPPIANSPTMEIDVTVNGVAYKGTPTTITAGSITFNYSNGSTLTVDTSSHSFSYVRATDDVSSADPDNYVFELTITVNGESTIQTLSINSMAGQRVYDYEPAYPVLLQAGSPETQRTAWGKYIEENKRLYRLLNENLNYYENLAYQLKQKMSELEDYINDKMKEVENKLNDTMNKVSKIHVKAITGVAYHGQTIPVPEGSDRNNCICLVSLNRWTNTRSDNKYCYDMYIWVNANWTLTCYTYTNGRNGTGGTYPGYANYLVIDVTTLI